MYTQYKYRDGFYLKTATIQDSARGQILFLNHKISWFLIMNLVEMKGCVFPIISLEQHHTHKIRFIL